MLKFRFYELEQLEKQFAKIDTEKMFDDALLQISQDFKSLAQQTFKDKKSPFGKKWQQSISNPDTLIDSGDLLASVDSITQGNKVILFAGDGLDYAAIHNDGLGIMPMREFIPNKGKLPKKWKDLAIKAIEENYNSKILKKVKKKK